MEIKIRDHIRKNFENSPVDEIRASIEDSIDMDDEIVLPGMGVFFEILWKKSDEEHHEDMLKTLYQAFKKN